MSDHDVLNELKNILQEYLHEVEGSESIFISTLDGNIILEESSFFPDKSSLAPIAGSVIGLTESIVEIVNGKQLQSNITIMQDYILGLFKIYDKDNSLFLGVKSTRILSLGKMVNFAKSTISRINKELDKLAE